MKNPVLAKWITVSCVVIFSFFTTLVLKAQNDIIDLCPVTMGMSNCDAAPDIEIPFNFDGSGTDSLVIIKNILGYRLLNPTPPDKQYKFCAANFNFCSTGATNDGVFEISFRYNSSAISVNKINFAIYNNSGGTVTVTSYQGAIGTTVAGTLIAGGRRYICEDNTTPFDKIVIGSAFSSTIDQESELFVLDDLHLPTEQANQPPTDITLSANTINENQPAGTTVGILSSVDPDATDSHSYTLVSGTGDTDNGSFSISGTSLLSGANFNYEAKSSYSIRVQTDDGHGNTFSKEFTININDVIETSSFNIVAIADANVNENSSYTGTTPVISGTPVGSVTYSKGGLDAALFNIDLITGIISMVPRNYESPEDANSDNIYEISITATDADNNSDSESWMVTVNNINEPASFTINTIPNVSIDENTVYTSATPVINGTPIGSLHFSLGGNDAGDFNINTLSGVATMAGHDFETPLDANTDNIYELSITATDDDDNSAGTSWTVTINDVTETATFSINNILDASVSENNAYTSITPVISGTPVGTLTYSKEGVDATLYSVNPASGVVTMVERNYENPEDSNGDNTYEIIIRATDTDNNSATENWIVTVNDVIETVSLSIDPIADVTIDENIDYTSVTPQITGTPIGSLHYNLAGVDAGNFAIDPSTGIVTMEARDYETPLDANHDNIYMVTITASDDDNNTGSENWTITINNLSSEGLPEIVCLLDLSFSMNRDFNDMYTSDADAVKLALAKNALIAFTDLLYSFNPGTSSMGLARFPNSPQTGCDAGAVRLLQILNQGYHDELVTNIPGLIADGGSTPLLAGIDFAKNMFNSDNKKVIVLLSDGRMNCPTSNVTSAMTTACTNALNAAGITLYTIGFGLNTLVPNDMLNILAGGTSGGAHFNVAAVSDKSPAYDPLAPDTWNPATALNATYASIFADGLGLNPCTDPLDIINKGIVKLINIPVTIFDDKVCFFVSWVKPNQNYLGIKLLTPFGNELPLNQTGVMTINRANHTIITLSGEVLDQPGMTGNWKLKIDGSDILDESEHFQYSVINSSRKLNLHTWFEKEKYFTGDKMKIFLELTVAGKSLSGLDSVFVKGTRPGEGLGNWLNSKKVNDTLLKKATKRQVEEYLKWTTNKLTDQNYYEKQKQIFLKNIDPVQLRAQVLKDEYKLTYPRRIIIDGLRFNDAGLEGDAKAGDGIYTAVHTPVKEGSYQFYVSAIDTSKGKTIHRENQLQKYVNVRIRAKSFIKKYRLIEELPGGEKIYNIILNLKDPYGNVPAPTALGDITLTLNEGKLIGNIVANPDGTFTQKISIPENIKARNLNITLTFDNQSGTQKLQSNFILSILGLIVLILIGRTMKMARKKK